MAKTEESPASARVASAKGKQRARTLAEMAGVVGPNSSVAHLALGDAMFDLDPVFAEAQYRQALSLDMASAAVHIKLAEAARTQGRNDEAIKELREALRINPASAAAHT